jgi:DNA-binding response OmpR family regulator
MGTPAVDLHSVTITADTLRLLPEDVVRRLGVLPLEVREGQLFVAIADPQNGSALDEVAFRTGYKVVALAAPDVDLATAIEDSLAARRRGDAGYRGRTARPGGPLAEALVRADDDAGDDGIPVTLGGGTDPPRGAPPPPVDLAAGAEAEARRPRRPSMPEPFLEESSFQRSPATSTPGRRARPRILVVDDEPAIRHVVRQTLAGRNMEVVEAGSGMEALRLLKEKEPDALVLDGMLPDVHGFDICKRLRESQRYASLPIIMVTAVYKGWRMAADAKEAYGVYAYIEKPFDLRVLVQALEDALAGRVAARASAEAYGDEAKRLYAEASDAYRRGDLDSAIGHLASAVAVEPLSAALRHQLGLLFAQRGHDFQAIQELEMAVDLEPTRYQSLRNLAILFQRRGFRRKASEMWERAMSSAPDEATRAEIREILRQLI